MIVLALPDFKSLKITIVTKVSMTVHSYRFIPKKCGMWVENYYCYYCGDRTATLSPGVEGHLTVRIVQSD